MQREAPMMIPGGAAMKIGMILGVAYLIVVYIGVILLTLGVGAAVWWGWRSWRSRQTQAAAPGGGLWSSVPQPAPLSRRSQVAHAAASRR
jgi:hypothetical protein